VDEGQYFDLIVHLIELLLVAGVFFFVVLVARGVREDAQARDAAGDGPARRAPPPEEEPLD